MTDREKLLGLLNQYHMDSIEAILNCFFTEYEDDISASRVNGLVDMLNNRLKHKITKLEQTKYIAYERASYLKCYLRGDMWATEEAAKANLQPQIDNAQAIIDACKG